MEKMIEKRQEVLEFLRVDEFLNGYGYGSGYDDGSGYGDGYGSGYGSGYGDGYGSGYDDGSGYGDGYGSGYGDGSGSGDGYGSGYGDGSGSGYGDGDGSGYGYGSGYGDGYGDGSERNIKVVNGMIIHRIDCIPTIIDSVHHRYAKGRILNSDLTTKPCFIARCGNYFAHGDTLEEAVKDARVKYEENLPMEERIKLFNQQYPDRDKKVPAAELFQWHNKLTGSCLAGRKHFCEEHGLDYEHGEYTVNEFIELTIDAYGGDVIKRLKDSRPK